MPTAHSLRPSGADLFERLSLEALLARYGSGRRRERIEPIYRSMLAEAGRLASPAALLAEVGMEAAGPSLQWIPPQPVALVLGVCTLGACVDERIHELMETSLAAAAVLDEIASLGVRRLTAQAHALVRAEAEARGLKSGAPYRPGLGRCPLEAQRMVFEYVPARDIGVSMNEHLLMTPPKSTSLVIPLYPTTMQA